MNTNRRRRNRSRWMKLEKPELMAAYMEAKGFSQARVARHAECSRQFIWALLNGDRNTCTKAVADRIEECLSLLPGTLFLDSLTSDPRHHAKSHKTRVAA